MELFSIRIRRTFQLVSTPQGDSTKTKKGKNRGKRAGHKVREGREKPKQGKGRRGKKKTYIMQS